VLLVTLIDLMVWKLPPWREVMGRGAAAWLPGVIAFLPDFRTGF